VPNVVTLALWKMIFSRVEEADRHTCWQIGSSKSGSGLGAVLPAKHKSTPPVARHSMPNRIGWDSASSGHATRRRGGGCGWCPGQMDQVRAAGRSRVPHHRDRNRAPARFDVALEMKNLLPRAQQKLTILDGDGEGRTQHRCLQV